MKRAPETRPELDCQDARLVARLAREYAPRPLGPAEREAFDARLRARLERRRLQLLVPALATAAGAALVFLVGRGFAPEPQPAERLAEARPAAAPTPAAEWEALLYADDVPLAESETLDARALPADYVAISSLILER